MSASQPLHTVCCWRVRGTTPTCHISRPSIFLLKLSATFRLREVIQIGLFTFIKVSLPALFSIYDVLIYLFVEVFIFISFYKQ